MAIMEGRIALLELHKIYIVQRRKPKKTYIFPVLRTCQNLTFLKREKT